MSGSPTQQPLSHFYPSTRTTNSSRREDMLPEDVPGIRAGPQTFYVRVAGIWKKVPSPVILQQELAGKEISLEHGGSASKASPGDLVVTGETVSGMVSDGRGSSVNSINDTWETVHADEQTSADSDEDQEGFYTPWGIDHDPCSISSSPNFGIFSQRIDPGQRASLLELAKNEEKANVEAESTDTGTDNSSATHTATELADGTEHGCFTSNNIDDCAHGSLRGEALTAQPYPATLTPRSDNNSVYTADRGDMVTTNDLNGEELQPDTGQRAKCIDSSLPAGAPPESVESDAKNDIVEVDYTPWGIGNPFTGDLSDVDATPTLTMEERLFGAEPGASTSPVAGKSAEEIVVMADSIVSTVVTDHSPSPGDTYIKLPISHSSWQSDATGVTTGFQEYLGTWTQTWTHEGVMKASLLYLFLCMGILVAYWTSLR